MRVERSILKRVSGATKLISMLNRLSMKLQSKVGGLMSVKGKLFMGLFSPETLGVWMNQPTPNKFVWVFLQTLWIEGNSS
eukprot:1161108-Pelagomonas_calceolata.AAC.13